MYIREYTPDDKEVVDYLRERYYTDNEIVNFLYRFHCAFVVQEGGQIITVGGVRPIAEIVARTDKAVYPRMRREALYKLMQASLFTCNKMGYDQLHCFSGDPKWSEHLQKVGFTPEQHQCLILDLK